MERTKSASREMGRPVGFVRPVAVTAAVWKEINAIPPRAQGLQSVRGRTHDVLWMAAIASAL
jgi:hypothetical protein